MKAAELRDKTPDQLREQLAALKKEAFNLRFQQATGQLELFLPMAYAIESGDVFRIHPGCDKRLETCIDRFANVLNFRGEPYVPGQDLLMSYPDAR